MCWGMTHHQNSYFFTFCWCLKHKFWLNFTYLPFNCSLKSREQPQRTVDLYWSFNNIMQIHHLSVSSLNNMTLVACWAVLILMQSDPFVSICTAPRIVKWCSHLPVFKAIHIWTHLNFSSFSAEISLSFVSTILCCEIFILFCILQAFWFILDKHISKLFGFFLSTSQQAINLSSWWGRLETQRCFKVVSLDANSNQASLWGLPPHKQRHSAG